MTRAQLETMTKQDLNIALTPYMGGFTKSILEKRKKEELVDLLIGYHEKEKSKPKKTGKRGRKTDPIAYKNGLEKIRIDLKANYSGPVKPGMFRGKVVAHKVKTDRGMMSVYLHSNGDYTIYLKGGHFKLSGKDLSWSVVEKQFAETQDSVRDN